MRLAYFGQYGAGFQPQTTAHIDHGLGQFKRAAASVHKSSLAHFDIEHQRRQALGRSKKKSQAAGTSALNKTTYVVEEHPAINLPPRQPFWK